MTSSDAVQIRRLRQARVRLIRGRVIGYSAALFLVLWSLIAVLLVTGHDPVLSRQASASVATGSAGSATSSGSGATSATSGLGSDDSGSDDSGSEGSGSASSGFSNSAGSASGGFGNSTGSSGVVSPSPVTSGQS